MPRVRGRRFSSAKVPVVAKKTYEYDGPELGSEVEEDGKTKPPKATATKKATK